VSEPALVPAPLYGVRTWRVEGEAGSERLAGPHQGDSWPPGGEWLEARCSATPEHEPPNRDCDCGLHAWHPSPRSARRVLARRGEVAGIAEARGAVELHVEGFRAQRARPHTLLLTPGANASLVRRLAETYRAEVVEAEDANAVLHVCRSRGLGLDERTVVRLMGPEAVEGWRSAKRAGTRRSMLRLAAALIVAALLVVAGGQLTDPPGDRVLYGRTGEIQPQSR
jgi:hypothetical protein